MVFTAQAIFFYCPSSGFYCQQLFILPAVVYTAQAVLFTAEAVLFTASSGLYYPSSALYCPVFSTAQCSVLLNVLHCRSSLFIADYRLPSYTNGNHTNGNHTNGNHTYGNHTNGNHTNGNHTNGKHLASITLSPIAFIAECHDDFYKEIPLDYPHNDLHRHRADWCSRCFHFRSTHPARLLPRHFLHRYTTLPKGLL